MHGTSHAGPRLLDRFSSALRRRARSWWRQLTVGARPAAAEAALEQLKRCAGAGEGLSPTCGTSAVCPGLSAAAVPTLWNFGETELALRFARRLLTLQRRDGSLPDAGLLHVSLFNTAQAARAWRTLLDAGALPEAESALRRACSFLAARISEEGVVHIPNVGGAFERWAPAAAQLAGFSEVALAAKRWNVSTWKAAIVRAAAQVCRSEPCDLGSGQTHVVAHGFEALLDLAEWEPCCEPLARRALEQAAALQRSDGSVATDLVHGWTSSAGLAHLAALWFRIGDKKTGDRAMTCLTAHQRDDGAWNGSWGRGAAYFPNGCSAWTVKYFLDSSLAQVDAAFSSAPAALLEPPTDEDGRRRVLERIAGEVIRDCGDSAELIDVGCGSGRFLTPLAKRFPRLRLTGIDPAARLLRHLPCGVDAVAGNMLRLPRRDESCDAVCCIEALEHALAPRRAVDELCRVVRPGGRVVVIDKDARFQSLSQVEPWERWFSPETLREWLSKHCDRVTCEPLPPGPQQRTPGLFLCWTGVKRRTNRVESLRRAA